MGHIDNSPFYHVLLVNQGNTKCEKKLNNQTIKKNIYIYISINILTSKAYPPVLPPRSWNLTIGEKHMN